MELAGTTAECERVDVAALRGTVVVLNVWYADCPPCRVEAPVLQQIADDYADKGVHFVGINTRNDSAEAVRAFQQTFAITYPSIRDSDGSALLALRQRGVSASATPMTVVLDARGRVAALAAGQVEGSTLTGLLDDTLSSKLSVSQ
ncbi:TlpA disulfide reductase family protein [Kineococcus glutinatus]|uniref:TlpA disulfide reductase family protein n=1 Tax=Kineococcus glutinatus TaxID=1070872 RepID=UPI0031E54BFF